MIAKVLLQGAIGLRMAITRQQLLVPFIRKTRAPMAAQHKVLLEILRQNAHTRYGRAHDFSRIRSIREYRQKVPVNDYESLRKHIECQEASGTSCLTREQPILFARTSGTSGQPKNIPILQSTVRQYRRSQQMVASLIHRTVPGAFSGKVLAIGSPAVEGYTDRGTPYGAMSGLIYESMPAMLRKRYVLHPAVFHIQDHAARYLEIIRQALAERQVSLIATANPSTFIRLDRLMNEHAAEMIDAIGQHDAARAAELDRLVSTRGRLLFADVWPQLKAVNTWTGGNCAVLIPALRQLLPERAQLVELGYLSSEFRGTITLVPGANLQVPTLDENFFEFAERHERENGRDRLLTLDQLQLGRQYYVVVTSRNGLYRYDINDLVEVTGRYNATPTIRFLQKGRGVTSLTGEKLCECQVVQALTEAVESEGRGIGFFKMLACPDARQYTLYVEADTLDADAIDERLCRLNIEYAAKRHSGRLKALRVVRLKAGAGEAYRQHHLDRGQRETQFKMDYLEQSGDCSFDFEAFEQKRQHAVA
jgi:hypothetical protein